jgi:hypothetical protein
LTLAPGQRLGVTFEQPIAPGPVHVAIDGGDDLALDDRAITFIPAAERVTVAIAGEPDAFSERALAIDPLVERITWRTGVRCDVVLAYGQLPTPAPPCPVIVFAPERAPAGVELGSELRDITLTRWQSDHTALRYLELADVAIYRARALAGPAVIPLVHAGDQLVIAATLRGTIEDIVVGFDLAQSNWTLRASFPLFIFNLIERARETRRAKSPRTLRPGETMPISAIDDRAVVVTPPVGPPITLPPPGELRFFHQTDRVGVYQVDSGSERHAFAVNLLDATESNLKPAAQLDLAQPQRATTEDDDRLVDKPLWQWLALLALVAGLIEWWVFHRKIA